jgi:hypothetical protein
MCNGSCEEACSSAAGERSGVAKRKAQSAWRASASAAQRKSKYNGGSSMKRNNGENNVASLGDQ